VALGGVVAAACDQGHQDDTNPTGPFLHVTGSSASPSRPVPTNGSIDIFFDRLLQPATVLRQAFVLRNADGSVAASPLVTYDPVLRKVTLYNPNSTQQNWLNAGQTYKVTFPIPNPGDVMGGVLAIDNATLDPSADNSVGFRVCAATAADPCPAPAYQPPAIDFCNDIQPIFQNHCSAGQCHGAPPQGSKTLPAAGLILDTSNGIAYTAVGRVAQGSNTGAQAAVSPPPGRIWNANMQLVHPNDPGDSWLLYKLMLALPSPYCCAAAPPVDAGAGADGGVDAGMTSCTTSNVAACETDSLRVQCSPSAAPPTPAQVFATPGLPPVPDFTAFQSQGDFARGDLAKYILGREMPYPSDPSAPPGAPTDNPPLSYDELERISLWIAAGAAVVECGACQ